LQWKNLIDHGNRVRTGDHEKREAGPQCEPATFVKKNFAIGTEMNMSKPKIALKPKHPERICWGCDKYCSADDLRCGNGTIRTQHPVELFGEDWIEWELNSQAPLAIENAEAETR
jgi:hypothetical protein